MLFSKSKSKAAASRAKVQEKRGEKSQRQSQDERDSKVMTFMQLIRNAKAEDKPHMIGHYCALIACVTWVPDWDLERLTNGCSDGMMYHLIRRGVGQWAVSMVDLAVQGELDMDDPTLEWGIAAFTDDLIRLRTDVRFEKSVARLRALCKEKGVSYDKNNGLKELRDKLNAWIKHVA